MDSEKISFSVEQQECCQCDCGSSSINGSSRTWLRSVRRRYDGIGHDKFSIPGLVYDSIARIDIENEIVALREMASSQQQAIQDLLSELEEERSASSSAANEAMSMILRLQREKAEVQMEARQFKRFAEEKMGHDQQEISALEEFLYKREQVIQSLAYEVQAYKHRMMSYGLTEADADGENSPSRTNEDGLDIPVDLPSYEYPPPRCNTRENYSYLDEGGDTILDIDKYAFGETPRDHPRNLDFCIYQMERNPSNMQFNSEPPSARSIQEKMVVCQSPRKPRHLRRASGDSSSSFFSTGREMGDLAYDSLRLSNMSFKKTEHISQPEEYSKLRRMNNISEAGDGMSDRIYTVDSIHARVTNYYGCPGICEDYLTTPRESLAQTDIRDPDIKKLYSRLHALEADRELMKQTIMSMQTDKAQLLLLREIAQQLCKDTTDRSIPRKKTSLMGKFSIWVMFKWIGSFIFRRKKSRFSKHMFGLSPHCVGLLIILDKSLRTRQRRLLTRTITKARV
ncbi:hypothetical protein SAY86_017724 [Trapa natans]|uniref:GTD-binding domain-containing protein n=1 Tax=Trapa natans TaxID=22666 RepID=A0AAN7M6R0_TRANT|nr:hypothetical protein SAY86_017724 [Trapa natans]